MDGLRLLSLGALLCLFAGVQLFFGGSLFTLFHPVPFGIVLLGTAAILAVRNGFKAISASSRAVFATTTSEASAEKISLLAPKWVAACGAARKEGLLALEPHRAELESLSPRIARGLKRLMDGVAPEEALSLLESEHLSERERGQTRLELLSSLGSALGAFGLVSALLCLLPGLSDLSKLDQLSRSVQLSLVGLLWGSVLSAVVVAPIRERVSEGQIELETFQAKERYALKAIAMTEHPLALEEKLK
jgi:chemotaxis protein MotA